MYIWGEEYFETPLLKNVYLITIGLLVLSEFIIAVITNVVNKNSTGKKDKKDKGSCIVIMFGFWLSIISDAMLRGVIKLVLPTWILWIGVVFVFIGIILRAISIMTLRKFFTLGVQVNSEQKIIKKGPYKYIRHPAYSGTILSLIGVALCFRSLFGLLASIIIIGLTYGYRIKVEEKAMEESFGKEYLEYEHHTWRIIPHFI